MGRSELFKVQLGGFLQIRHGVFGRSSLTHAPHLGALGDVQIILLMYHRGKGSSDRVQLRHRLLVVGLTAPVAAQLLHEFTVRPPVGGAHPHVHTAFESFPRHVSSFASVLPAWIFAYLALHTRADYCTLILTQRQNHHRRS